MFTLLCFSSLFLRNYTVPVKASPKEIIVDQYERIPYDFTNITEAVDNAVDGDVITVRNGTYQENLLLNKSVSLVGINATIDGNNSGTVITITADEVSIKGFIIKRSGSRSYDSGIFIAEYVNGAYIGYNEIIDNFDGVSLFSSSNNMISHNTIMNNLAGITFGSSSSNIISHNTVTKNYEGIGLHHYCSNNTFLGNTVSSNNFGGISLHHYSSNNIISYNTVTGNFGGISLHYYSSNNIISYNTVTRNQAGITIGTSSNNTLLGNTVSSNTLRGIALDSSSNNTLSYNTITKSYEGLNLYSNSSGNSIYLNSFNNTYQLRFDPENCSLNDWDNGHEGNFWHNYEGTDLYSGPSLPQNETGSDGIGDTPLFLDANNQDRRPLMGPVSRFNVTLHEKTYYIVTICNSTISGFEFEVRPETGGKIVRFKVTGKEGTTGFCRITIPVELVDYPSFVWIDTEEIVPTRVDVPGDTHICLYFNYAHKSQTVTIAYSKTLNLYNQLLEEYDKLETDLLKLSDSYNQLRNDYTELQNSHQNLNDSYNQLQNDYNNFFNDYTELQNSHQNLNDSYNQLLGDYYQKVHNIQSLIYIIAATTAIFIVTVAYLSRSAHAKKTTISSKT